MQHVFPGVQGFPLSHRPLLHTRELPQAVQVIHELVEPFQLSWEWGQTGADIRITGASLERLKLFGVNHGAPIFVRSGPLQSHYIVLPVRGEVAGRVNSTDVRAVPGEALFYPADSCLHAHWSAQCLAMVLAISKEEFDSALYRYSPCAPPKPPLLPKLLLSSGAGRSFANLLGCLCAECDNHGDVPIVPWIREGLQELLLASLLHMNAHLWERGLFERASTRRRRTGVARAVDYIHANCARAVSAAELTRVACLSLRSLQIGFTECYGIGPMAYSKRLRLTRARENLATFDPRDVEIADIAARHGFHNASTFARLYRQQFGELPSETLRRVSAATTAAG
jgi:AraC-like DNA-binding protein